MNRLMLEFENFRQKQFKILKLRSLKSKPPDIYTWEKWAKITALMDKVQQPCCNYQYCKCKQKAQKKHERDPDGLHFDNPYIVPSVKSVNIKGCIVMTRQGTRMGPYTHEEWLEYAFDSWDYFWDLHHQRPHVCNPTFHHSHKWHPRVTQSGDTQSSSPVWANLYVRDPEDFKGGLLSFFNPIQLLIIGTLPSPTHQLVAYEDLHQGIDINECHGPIDKENPQKFRKRGHVFTKTVKHKQHQFRYGTNEWSLNEAAARESDTKLKMDYGKQRRWDKKQKLHFLHFVPDDVITISNLNKPFKHMPMFIHKNGKISKPQFDNHPKTMKLYHNLIQKQIETFIKSRVLR